MLDLLLIPMSQLKSQQRDRGGEQFFVIFFFVFGHKLVRHRDHPFFCVFVFFLTRLVSPTHPPFQVTTNISTRTGAEDRRPGGPPGDESDASRFRWNAEAAATGIGQVT